MLGYMYPHTYKFACTLHLYIFVRRPISILVRSNKIKQQISVVLKVIFALCYTYKMCSNS